MRRFLYSPAGEIRPGQIRREYNKMMNVKHSAPRKPDIPGKRKHPVRRQLRPWGYSLPAMILIAMIVLFPILYTGYISLTNMNLYHWTDYSLVGADNYKRALLKVDSGFLSAVSSTILTAVHSMVVPRADRKPESTFRSALL